MNKQLLTPVARETYSHLVASIDWLIWHKYGSQKEFAKVLNMDPSNLSKILTGVTSCSSRTFVEMCRLLGISFNFPVRHPVNGSIVYQEFKPKCDGC